MNRREFITTTGGALVAATAIGTMTGCGTGLDTALNIISAAADALLPFIPGIPAAAVPIIEAYLDAVVGGVEASATELASTDTALVKSEKIAAIWAAVVEPDLAKLGVVGTAATKVIALVNAILSFLTKLGSPAGATTTAQAARGVATHAQGSAASAAAVTTPLLTAKQAASVIKKARAVRAKLPH